MTKDMSFKETIQLFRSVYQRFEKIEGRSWGVEGAVIELIKQTGELAKHVMVAECYYPPPISNIPKNKNNKDNIGDELADIFSMIIRIADYYNIDLLKACLETRSAEDSYLKKRGA